MREAERGRELNAERCLEALGDIAKLLTERNEARARLAACREALDALDESGDFPRDRLDAAFDALGVERLGG